MGTLAIRLAALSAVPAASLVLAACGGGGSADVANGKQLFNTSCSGCHALADAENQPPRPPQGPNLDDAFRASRVQGYDPDGFRGVVRYWIANPDGLNNGNPAMPPNLVTGQDAEDVAAYVAQVAGSKDAVSPPRPAEPIEGGSPQESAGSEAP